MKKKSGFTLIELLVVVAIIAVLVSILLPALGQARAKAKQVQCASGLKQMGTECTMYTQAWNDWFPRCYVRPLPPNYYELWYHTLQKAGFLKDYPGQIFEKGDRYRCPSNDPWGPDSMVAGGNYNYALNYWSFGKWRKLDTVESPGTRMWISEPKNAGQGYVIYSPSLNVLEPQRHGGINILYADGHVGFWATMDIFFGLDNPNLTGINKYN